jgi:hypothetical protein
MEVGKFCRFYKPETWITEQIAKSEVFFLGGLQYVTPALMQVDCYVFAQTQIRGIVWVIAGTFSGKICKNWLNLRFWDNSPGGIRSLQEALWAANQ